MVHDVVLGIDALSWSDVVTAGKALWTLIELGLKIFG